MKLGMKINFKSPYPWAEPGRLCKTIMFEEETRDYKIHDVEIAKADYQEDKYFCTCKLLENNQRYYITYYSLDPIYTVEEIMQYAEKTIIEEHWVDCNSNECAIYLMKFCGEYFRIDECGNNISMRKIKI